MEENVNRNYIRLMVIACIILIAAIIGMIAIRDKKINTDVTAKTTKVGLVLTGGKDDASFCQANYEALVNISDDLNLEIICRENVREDESCAGVFEELCSEDGCAVIIGASVGYGEFIMEAAEKHPDICFIHTTGSERLANLSSCMGRMYQARYLSGIVAGMRTESGKLGYVAALPYSEVIRGINAFTLGVRSVAPDAEVYVRYCYSWVDDDAAETASKELLELHNDIDVFALHTNSMKPHYVADRRGIWSIGYNIDNAEAFSGTYLTSCVWRWDDYYKEVILNSLQGKFHGEVQWLGMETGIVGLSELTSNVAPGTAEAVSAAEKQFESRMFDVFYGPITDNEGVLRVPGGESMSDEDMMSNFDWYVEGVTVEE